MQCEAGKEFSQPPEGSNRLSIRAKLQHLNSNCPVLDKLLQNRCINLAAQPEAARESQGAIKGKTTPS
jgi:hypothetical protein